MTDRDRELLNYINRNAKMGGDNLETIIGDVRDARLKETLEKQIAEYRIVEVQAKEKLADAGDKPEDASKLTQLCCRVMINAKTLLDKSAEHIAEIVIQGSTMGIIDVTKQHKNYSDCNCDAVNLAYRLKCIEQKNLDEMKHFL